MGDQEKLIFISLSLHLWVQLQLQEELVDFLDMAMEMLSTFQFMLRVEIMEIKITKAEFGKGIRLQTFCWTGLRSIFQALALLQSYESTTTFQKTELKSGTYLRKS